MANETKPIDKQQLASDHLKKLLANLESHAGKAGVNPFLFKKEVIDPLVVAKDYDKLLAIPVDVVPKVSELGIVKEFTSTTAQISKAAPTKVS